MGVGGWRVLAGRDGLVLYSAEKVYSVTENGQLKMEEIFIQNKSKILQIVDAN